MLRNRERERKKNILFNAPIYCIINFASQYLQLQHKTLHSEFYIYI